MIFRGCDNLFNFLLPANIAGIDSKFIHACLGCTDRQSPVKMNIGNQRRSHFAFYCWQCRERLFVRNGHPDDLASGLFQ